eukprot:TRINITY_DN50311_c0_g1_i2.p1 TRINITY_DN50311_c0_g1~~TRINITY_DN50311_c0_g1_i2.p1  ORF type:complete len:110 (-),score=0.20 TRINITY_DN50311_c0_g1_i2:161-490(-)
MAKRTPWINDPTPIPANTRGATTQCSRLRTGFTSSVRLSIKLGIMASQTNTPMYATNINALHMRPIVSKGHSDPLTVKRAYRVAHGYGMVDRRVTVSYTHLTLPTKRIV